MKVAVVVLNWNTRDYLRAFIPGLLQSCARLGNNADGTPVARLIVADSGSTDGSREVLADEFTDVKTILLDRNYGFTGGYNKAFEKLDAEYDYYLLINSDIEVEDGWLEPLLDWMESHPDCGICGPKLHGLIKKGQDYVRSSRFEYAGAGGGLMDVWGFPYCRGRVRKKVEEDSGQYDNADPDVLWVTGACLMIRSSLWEQLGGFDSRFFAHMEEIDLCWRAQLAGWRVQVVPESLVWHLGGGTLEPASPFKLKLNWRNNLLLLENNLANTYIAKGMPETAASKKAARFIRFRVFLDNCARIVYFCTGNVAYAKAVGQAHAEWKELRKQASHNPAPTEGACVHGLTTRSIILKY